MENLEISQIDTVPPRCPIPGDVGQSNLKPDSIPASSSSAFLNREAACCEIARQNPAQPAPSSGATYVIAGQQAGLLTGPLYTFLKAVSVILLAKRLNTAADDSATPSSASANSSVLPLFWIAAEDHDLLEVNRVTVHTHRYVHQYMGELTRGRMPQVGSIPLSDIREPLMAFLREHLPITEYTPWVMTLIEKVDFSTYTSAFKYLLEELFSQWGLRSIDPIACRFLTAPILAGLVEQWPAVIDGLAAGADQLTRHRLKVPLTGARIFEIVDGLRVPVDLSPLGGTISEGQMSLSDLAETIRRRPADFSPSAALRPICQDGVFPVAVTVGGPTELLYLRQILPIYTRVGIKPSIRHSRISATFISSGVARAADKAGLRGAAVLTAGVEPTTAGIEPETAKSDPQLALVDEKSRALLEALDSLDRLSSPRWLRSGRASIEKGVNRIVGGLRDEVAAKTNRSRAQLAKISAAVMPGGKPQERVVNIIELLNRYGPDFVEVVMESLDPVVPGHQLVYLKTREGNDGH